MPSNIAHMLICHKAIAKLKEKIVVPQYVDFVNLLDDTSVGNNYRTYLNLGSLGPDLFYYANMVKGAKDMLIDGFVQAKGVEPWSYHLHSVTPNEFPLKLIEIVFRDVKRDPGRTILEQLEHEDYARLAFIAGYLTHIAADQIIHPCVNKVAGPYYRMGDNRKKHRECEVFQDYFLYKRIYQLEGKSGPAYDFFKQDFNSWVDCITGLTFRNTEDWFRYFLQRGFAETYNTFPDEDTIENSVDNLLLTLRMCKRIGPYKEAAAEYETQEEKSQKYQEYVDKTNYLKYYIMAVELALIYLIDLYEAYELLIKNSDFSKPQRKGFKKIVSSEDLSCPLTQDILDNAIKEFRNVDKIDTKLAEARDKIDLRSQDEILNAKDLSLLL